MSAELKNPSPKEAIIYIVSSSAEYYENYPDITSIMQILDVLSYDPELKDKTKSIVNTRFDFIKDLVEKAQKEGELLPHTDSRGIAELICGSIREICLIWRINGRDFSLKERTLSAVTLLLDTFTVKN